MSRERLSSRLLLVGPALLVLLVATAPLWTGQRTLFLRDVFNLHLPMKIAQAETMRSGALPLLDAARAGGQPLLANPNAVALYPDNLLYAVAPTLWAFNAHYWLHLLLAPFAMAWMARSLGLGRGPAWVAGIAFACSGYFLSQLNFYNLVAGVALAPALVAATVRLATPCVRRPGRAVAWVGGLLALVMLAGDPITLVLAGIVAVAAGTLRALDGSDGGPRAWRSWALAFAGAAVVGALLSAPQWIPFLENLGLSYRGHQGYGEQGALAGSWDPRSALEWIVPFAYGAPNLGFWGQSYYGGDLPLFFSFYPGAAALVLLLASGRPERGSAIGRLRMLSWALVGLGVFVALGSANPAIRLALELPGSGLLRFPVKAWLWVALGGSLLVGCGAQRLQGGASRDVARAAGLVSLVFLCVTAGTLQFSDAFAAWLADQGVAARLGEIRPRWVGLPLVGLVLAWVPWVLARGLKEQRLMAALAGAHALTQLVLLSPLYENDEASAYRVEPKALQLTAPGESLVQGGIFDVFSSESAPVSFPSRSLRWVQRRGWDELYPFAGVQYGRRYELNVSPEGLDAFLTQMTAEAVKASSDVGRVRILEALGVDALILDRDLSPEAAARVSLRGGFDSFGAPVRVYGIDGVEDVQVLGRVIRAPHLNAALQVMTHPDFDPRVSVVLPGAGESVTVTEGEVGEILELEERGDTLRLRVRAPGPAAVLVQRSHLAQYRATIDGVAQPLVAGNMSRLALEIDAGEHEILISVPRVRVRWAFALCVVGLVLAVVLLFRRPSTEPSPTP